MELAESGVRRTRLGSDLLAGERVQYVVPAGVWFGAYLEPAEAESYALVGCTVAPGFNFADFEMGERGELLRAFPRAYEDIMRLTA